MKHQPLIKKLRAGLNADETGNKANSLIFLHHYGFNIPLTFLVTTRAHRRYLSEGLAVLDELAEEIAELPEKSYAIRSSTTAEDSKEYSFAGQFLTLVNIAGSENILKAVQSVWDSVTLLNNSDYLKRTTVSEIKCGVIIQEMIPAELAGVSFSRNPVTDQNEIVIEAVEGAGEELVQKGLTPMRWRVRKDLVMEGNEQYTLFPVIRKVAKDTARLRRYYGQHIDIEWVYDGKQLYYLQLRQITGRKEVNIYSNRMAKEMLPGQIKPLVWSVNIPLVNGTWLGILSAITGPLEVRPEELARPFYYQAYFNIKTLGKIFSEFGMSADSLDLLMTRNESGGHSFRPGLKMLRHTFRIIGFLNSMMRFEKRFPCEYDALMMFYKDYAAAIGKEFSAAAYHEDYNRLFDTGHRLAYMNIITPMLMTMYHKRLRKRLSRAGIDYDLLDNRKAFPDLVDYAPLHEMNSIRKELESLPTAVRESCTTLESLRHHPDTAVISSRIDKFIEKFGHLSDSGTDFSYAKWEEDPEMVYRMILLSTEPPERKGYCTIEAMKANGVRVSSGLYRRCIRAGRLKLYREQISSLYIYGYGLFRRLFLKVGASLTASDIIDSPEDIFMLTKSEVDNIVDNPGKVDRQMYRKLVKERREEMERTRDLVLPTVIYGDDAPLPDSRRHRNQSGTGTSSGSYVGTTRVVRNRSDFESVRDGDVILIPFSDVSWTPVLARAGAIVSETGGMLSHCSIIARELGIPALVSVPNACALGNGLTVTVNGSNGILTIHDYE
ncbi:hypothetical protein EG827_01015 [bacterium]|nr:hypothetical protein [bacterium]